jgi:hypothetical protein
MKVEHMSGASSSSSETMFVVDESTAKDLLGSFISGTLEHLHGSISRGQVTFEIKSDAIPIKDSD